MSDLDHRIRELRRIVPPDQRYDPTLDGPRPVFQDRTCRFCNIARILVVITLLGTSSVWLAGYRIVSPQAVDLLAHFEQAGLVREAALGRDTSASATYMQAAQFLRDLLVASRRSDGSPLAQAAGMPSGLTADARAQELLHVLRTHLEHGRTDLITVAAGILALRQDGLMDAVSTLGTLDPQVRQRLFENNAARLKAWLRHENLQLIEEAAARERADELRRHRDRLVAADRERRAQIRAFDSQYAAFQAEAQGYLQLTQKTHHARIQLLACIQSVQRRIGAN